MGDACRITTEDGAGLDRDMKKLKAITATVNEKALEKNRKMAYSKVQATDSTRRSTKTQGQTLVNTWVDTKDGQETPIAKRVLRDDSTKKLLANEVKHSQTPSAQLMKSSLKNDTNIISGFYKTAVSDKRKETP